MNFVADESVNHSIIRELRKSGMSVLAVAEKSPGITDREVIHLTNREQSFLLTADRDFGDLIFRDGLKCPTGVMLLRIAELSNDEQGTLVARTLLAQGQSILNHFCVLTARALRVRPISFHGV